MLFCSYFSGQSFHDRETYYIYGMNDFIAVDFETGMRTPSSVVSIGLVKYQNFQLVDTYYSLIRPPELYIRPDFTEIHGLTVEDVKNAPTFTCIWDDIKSFIANYLLAAHNANFDMRVFKAVLECYGIVIPKLQYFCTCDLARQTWPDMASHSLSNLANEFGIIYKAHNALDDAITCGKLVQMSVEKLGKKKTLKGFLRAAGIRMNVMRP